jgi:hypothetical protein
MIILPLGIALVISTCAHFLRRGADNMLRLPPGDLRISSQISAVLLAARRGAWLLGWHSHIRTSVGATCVEHLKENDVGRLNWWLNPTRKEKNSMSVNIDERWPDRTAKAILLIRILVGWIFLSNGIQTFLSLTPSEADAL